MRRSWSAMMPTTPSTAPAAGGYYVVYEDGYQSYSPAKAFEDGYAPVETTFMQRAIAESREVSRRLSKLLAFFQSDTFARLPEAERSRMRNQARFMDGYAAVLEERIAAFGGAMEERIVAVAQSNPGCADGGILDGTNRTTSGAIGQP